MCCFHGWDLLKAAKVPKLKALLGFELYGLNQLIFERITVEA